MRYILPALLTAAVVLFSAGCSDEDPVLHQSDPPVIVDQDLWYVDSAASGARTGSSWDNAFTHVKEALDNASEGDVIWVAAGTYGCPEPGDSSIPVVMMKQYVDIYGGFSTADTTLSQRDPEVNRTVLDGENRAWHVVIGADHAKLDGFTIQSGHAHGIYPDNCGGGMFNEGVSPEVMNCIFTSNESGFLGAGMANFNASPCVENCIFRINSAFNNGAGVYNDGRDGFDSRPQFESCVFGPGNSCRFGAGMFNSWCEVELNDCLFYDNLANHNGGGLYNTSSKVLVKNCVFRENRAGYGGGIYMNGIAAEDSTKLMNCLIETNTAYASGGGVYLLKSSAVLINCTIVENVAIYGGGISCWGSEAEFTNSIVWGNVAHYSWPAIEIGTEEIPEIGYCDIDQAGYGLSGSGLADAEGNISLAPLFTSGPLGGWYLSHIVAGEAEDSPCIDAGRHTAISAWLMEYTTRTDGAPDSGPVDIGFHHAP